LKFVTWVVPAWQTNEGGKVYVLTDPGRVEVLIRVWYSVIAFVSDIQALAVLVTVITEGVVFHND